MASFIEALILQLVGHWQALARSVMLLGQLVQSIFNACDAILCSFNNALVCCAAVTALGVSNL